MDTAYKEWFDWFETQTMGHHHKNEEGRKLAVVMVDTERRWQIPSVVKNFSWFLGNQANFYVFHGPHNETFLSQAFKEPWDIRRFLLSEARISNDQYSSLLMTENFWDTFSEPWVLMIQHDCLCCQPIDEKWFQYDYVGAPCGMDDKILNGGLSLRRRSFMLDMIRRYKWFWPDPVPEDVFFTKAAMLANARIPNGYDAACFSVESYFYQLPFGVHGTDKGYVVPGIPERIVKSIDLDKRPA